MTSMKFKLPVDLKDRLVAFAANEGESEATIIRRAQCARYRDYSGSGWGNATEEEGGADQPCYTGK